jgi:hypothetical protein
MEVTRTLVKSPPELWAELSDVAALARHLGEFGTIRIVRTEPESVVEWEGDRASGSVRLEPSGWGTRVTLTAAAVAAEPPEVAEPEPAAAEPEPVTVPTEQAPRRRGFWARLFRRREDPPAPPPAPELVAEPPPAEPPAPTLDEAKVLAEALHSLGSAHHRPFSR